MRQRRLIFRTAHVAQAGWHLHAIRRRIDVEMVVTRRLVFLLPTDLQGTWLMPRPLFRSWWMRSWSGSAMAKRSRATECGAGKSGAERVANGAADLPIVLRQSKVSR
jgi:hypothetical protein